MYISTSLWQAIFHEIVHLYSHAPLLFSTQALLPENFPWNALAHLRFARNPTRYQPALHTGTYLRYYSFSCPCFSLHSDRSEITEKSFMMSSGVSRMKSYRRWDGGDYCSCVSLSLVFVFVFVIFVSASSWWNSFAGSKFTNNISLPISRIYCCIPLQYVLLIVVTNMCQFKLIKGGSKVTCMQMQQQSILH